MNPLLALVFSFALLFCGCNKSTPSAVPLAKTEPEQPSGPSIRELPNEGKLMKELLDVDTYVFEFSGTLLAVWLEAETKVGGEETIVRRMGPVEVTRSRIKNDSPESIRGKFVLSGKFNSSGEVFQSPRLSMLFKGGGSTASNPDQPLAPAWPKIKAVKGARKNVVGTITTGYQWECPSELPGEGQEFVIASISKSYLGRGPYVTDVKVFGMNVSRQTTIKIKGRRLHEAPEPAAEEKEAVTALREIGASVYLQGSKYGDAYQGDPKTSAKGVNYSVVMIDKMRDSFVHLKQLPKLESLSFALTEITDADLVHLKDRSTLKELRLGKNVTDAGLENLKGLTSLTVLELQGTQITDAGLKHLLTLESLQDLQVSGTAISNDGVAQLKSALPSCRISANEMKPKKKTSTPAAELLEDDFGDGSLEPRWKSYANDGLTVEESDGVAKIFGIVPNFPERYVSAGFELTDAIPAESFEAQIDVHASSGTFGGAEHRQRSFSFFANGSNGNSVGVQFWAGQYRISYNNGNGGQRTYAPSNGDEMTKWHVWRIVYDTGDKTASVFIGDRQIGDTVIVDLGDSVTFKVLLKCMPNTRIKGNFDNFRLDFRDTVQSTAE